MTEGRRGAGLDPDPERIWSILVAAARGDSAGAAALPDISLGCDGSWTSARALDAESEALLDIYWPLCAAGAERLVMAQIGQSLDGRIATESGHSHYVTAEADIVHLHRLRALSDVVLVGAGTACADDPRLTVRVARGRNPVRAVLDPKGRVPPRSRVFIDAAAPTIHLVGADVHVERRPGVDIVRLTATDSVDVPRHVIELLAARGLRRILVEGGGVTVSHFLAAGCLDRLHVTVASLIIGSGRPAFSLPSIQRLDEALWPECHRHPLGPDVLYDLALKPLPCRRPP